MSGGGGGGGGGPIDETDCGKFVRTTELASPDPAVLKTVNEGDVGKLTLSANRAVQVIIRKQVLGSVIPPGVTRLKQCLDQGFAYKATIVQKKGAIVKVDIRPA